MALAKLPLSFFSLPTDQLGPTELGAHRLAAPHPVQPFLSCWEQLILLDKAENVITHREPPHQRPAPKLLVQLRRQVLDLEVAHSMTLVCCGHVSRHRDRSRTRRLSALDKPKPHRSGMEIDH